MYKARTPCTSWGKCVQFKIVRVETVQVGDPLFIVNFFKINHCNLAFMSCSKKLGFLIWFDSIEGNVAGVACVVGLLGKPASKEAKFQKMSTFKKFLFHVDEFRHLHESCQLNFEIGVENWIFVFFLSFSNYHGFQIW